MLTSTVPPPRTQTALQVYCKTYKQAQVSETHGLLRKARRLDKILEANGDTSSSASLDEGLPGGPEPQCYRCRTEFSPFFHEVPAQGGARAWLCHKCHAETRSAAAAAVSAAAAYHGQQHPAMIGIGAA